MNLENMMLVAPSGHGDQLRQLIADLKRSSDAMTDEEKAKNRAANRAYYKAQFDFYAKKLADSGGDQ